MKSASSGQKISLSLKLKEVTRQFARLVKLRPPWRKRNFEYLNGYIEEYDRILTKYRRVSIQQCRVYEIGCGQRPYRLLSLIARGIDARGVDMDRVILSMSLKSIFLSLLNNGFERTLKTVARYFIFDRRENKELKKYLSSFRGRHFSWPLDRIAHGGAENLALWPPEKVDFIFSEDVFEHVPKDMLQRICMNMWNRLSDNGIAFIRPMVFTGIKGGHNVEWYDAEISARRECPPWDHLRDRKYPANTYLNEFRLSDYRRMFGKYFYIVEEISEEKEYGKYYLSDEMKLILKEYSEEELYSNNVAFILKKKPSFF